VETSVMRPLKRPDESWLDWTLRVAADAHLESEVEHEYARKVSGGLFGRAAALAALREWNL
jgi:hypothetical protein